MPPRPRLVTATAPVPDPPSAAPAPPQSRADLAFVGTLTAIAALLAARLLLLLAVLGAFVLAVRADGTPGLLILIAFCLLTVAPLVFLDVVTHQRRGT